MGSMSLSSPPSGHSFHQKYRFLFFIAVIVVIGIASVVYFFVSRSQTAGYQAIFLSNGQVYFGKIIHRGWKTIDVQDVYYLQAKNAIAATPPADDVSLIKLGNELHGPEDSMEVNWDHVLFIESLRADSRVVRAIENYHRR